MGKPAAFVLDQIDKDLDENLALRYLPLEAILDKRFIRFEGRLGVSDFFNDNWNMRVMCFLTCVFIQQKI